MFLYPTCILFSSYHFHFVLLCSMFSFYCEDNKTIFDLEGEHKLGCIRLFSPLSKSPKCTFILICGEQREREKFQLSSLHVDAW